MSDQPLNLSQNLAKYTLSALIIAGDHESYAQQIAEELLAGMVKADWLDRSSMFAPIPAMMIDEPTITAWIEERYPYDWVRHVPDVISLITKAYADFGNWRSDAGIPDPF